MPKTCRVEEQEADCREGHSHNNQTIRRSANGAGKPHSPAVQRGRQQMVSPVGSSLARQVENAGKCSWVAWQRWWENSAKR